MTNIVVSKFKLISALTDETIDELIKGSGNMKPPPKSKTQLAHERRAMRKEEEQKEKREEDANRKAMTNKQNKGREQRAVRGRSIKAGAANSNQNTSKKNKYYARGNSGQAAAEEEEVLSHDDDTLTEIVDSLFSDSNYEPSYDELTATFEEIYKSTHIYFNEDGTETTHIHYGSAEEPFQVDPNKQLRKDLTQYSDTERLLLRTGNNTIYSGNRRGSGTRKKKKRANKARRSRYGKRRH